MKMSASVDHALLPPGGIASRLFLGGVKVAMLDEDEREYESEGWICVYEMLLLLFVERELFTLIIS